MLFPSHITSLAARAIPEHVAEAAGITSASAAEVSAALGSGASSAAMLIPYFDEIGEPAIGEDGVPLVRARMDEGTPKYRGRGSGGYAPYFTPRLITLIVQAAYSETTKKLDETLVLTEGELKALSVSHNLLMPAVGLPGVTMYWHPDRDRTEPPTAQTPLHPDLAAVVARFRRVVVIADSDAADKPQVRSAMTLLREAISVQLNVLCAYVEVPAPKKGRGRPKKDEAGLEASAPKIGIDDWIASVGAQGCDGIVAYLKKALAHEEARQKALRDGGYIPLGYTIDEASGAGSYYVYSTETRAISRIESANLTNLNSLIHNCGAAWLLAMYPKTSKDGHVSIDNVAAGGDLAAACKARGLWVESRRVGAGVWPIPGDSSAIIVNSAAGLWASDGREVPAVAVEHHGPVYMSSVELGVTPETVPATEQDAEEVMAALQTFTWANPQDAGMYLGWLSAAMLCGALSHRPMLYVTGRRASGKSTLLTLGRDLLGSLATPRMEGTSLTEPALRRMLGRSSRASFIDEAESTDNPERLSEIMRYLRSSYSGGETSKGSAGSGVDTYIVRTMAALGAINPMYQDDAEQSRFIRLNLHPRSAGMRSHELITNRASAAELAPRLAARMIRSWGRFQAALGIASKLLQGGQDVLDRYITTVGTVVAAGWVMLHDGEPTVEDLKSHMATLDIASQRTRIVETRADVNPLEWLLDKIIQVDVMGRNSRISVRELVLGAGFEWRGARVSGPYHEALGRLGMRPGLDESGERILYVMPDRSEFRALFGDSRWAKRNLEEALITEVPGCPRKREDFNLAIGGVRRKPLGIPLGDLVCTGSDEDEVPRPLGNTAAAVATAYTH